MQNGQIHHLNHYIGKKIVIYFYPKDDTPGCTTQACAFRDAYDEFKKLDVVVIGISKDDEKSHQKFIKKYDLPFILLK
jgi:thioredoxin-dependent peroxiredoxin